MYSHQPGKPCNLNFTVSVAAAKEFCLKENHGILSCDHHTLDKCLPSELPSTTAISSARVISPVVDSFHALPK